MSHEPPASLREAGRALWIDQAAKLGAALDAEIERVALETVCRAADRLEEARRDLERDGVTIEDARGNLVRHPMLEVHRDAAAELQRGLKRYRAHPAIQAHTPHSTMDWAVALGCSRPTAIAWVRRGVLKQGMTAEQGRQAVEEHKRAKNPQQTTLKDEEAKLKAARRAMLELELEQKARALVPASAVAERWLRMSSRWVAAVRAMPARYDGELAGFSGKDAAECRRWLQKAVDETINNARLDDAE